MDWIKVEGNSMSPLLSSDALVEVAWDVRPSSRYEVGEIVVCRDPGGRFIVHRVVEVDATKVAIKGDATYGIEYFERNHIWGRVMGFKCGKETPKIFAPSFLDRIIAVLSRKVVGPSRLRTKVLKRFVFALDLAKRWGA